MTRRKPARYDLPYGESSITASDLSECDVDTQLDVMRIWFYDNYEDPAENTPYESAEGGYIYIWGGPYDAEEVLQDKFSEVVPDEVIAQLAKELSNISWEWTRPPGLDEYLFNLILQTTKHYESFQKSITNIERLLLVKVSEPERQCLLRLLYTNIITAVETYLADLFISTVINDRKLLRKFIESTPEFEKKSLNYSNIFKEVENIGETAKSYLLDVLWHRLDKVKLMYQDTLNISFPKDMGDLYRAVKTRHHLVHRNGKDKDGNELEISHEMVTELIQATQAFVHDIDEQAEKFS